MQSKNRKKNFEHILGERKNDKEVRNMRIILLN